MKRINWGSILPFIDDQSYQARPAGWRRALFTFIGGLSLAILLLIICAPALLAFMIADKSPEHRDVLVNLGGAWLLFLIGLVIIAMIILPVRAYRNYVRKREAIRKYASSRNTRKR